MAEPDKTPVNVALYVPSPLSVTAEKVPVLTPAPVVALNVTVEPPLGIEFPLASFACRVTVVEVPEPIDADHTVTME